MDITHICRRADCLFALDAVGGGRFLAPLATLAPPATPRESSVWAERTGVITCSNINSGDDGFGRTDRTAAANIATQLDFRGNKTGKTFIIKALLRKPPQADPGFFYHSFVSQGYQLGSATACVCGFGVLSDYRSTEYHRLQCGFGGVSMVTTQFFLPPDIFDRPHVFAGVIDYNHGFIPEYVDGRYVHRISFNTGLAFPTDNAEQCVNIRKTQYLPAETESQISHALIFDSALSDVEIAAISQVL